jgi:hypothetical protein
MEQYQVLCRGQVVTGQSRELVAEKLESRLKLTPGNIRQILSGNVVTLKSRLSWPQAQTFQQQLRKLGLVTELLLQLNATCLKRGLVVNHKSTQVSSAGADRVSGWIIDKQFLPPLIFSSKFTGTMNAINNKLSLQVKRHNSRWSTLALVLFAVFAAYLLQNYFLRLTIFHFHWGTAATVSSLILLAGLVLWLPKLLQPPMFVSLYADHSLAPFVLNEQYRAIIGKRTFHLHNASGTVINTLDYRNKQVTLFDNDSTIIYSWDNEIGVEKSAQDTAQEFRGFLLDNTSLGSLLDGIGVLKKLLSPFIKFNPSKSPSIKSRSTVKVQWNKADALPIRDQSGRIVAEVYKTPEPALKIRGVQNSGEQINGNKSSDEQNNDEPVDDIQQFQLLAMAMVMMGDSLV